MDDVHLELGRADLYVDGEVETWADASVAGTDKGVGVIQHGWAQAGHMLAEDSSAGSIALP